MRALATRVQSLPKTCMISDAFTGLLTTNFHIALSSGDLKCSVFAFDNLETTHHAKEEQSSVEERVMENVS